MPGEESVDVTRLLREWGAGNRAALEQLTPVITRNSGAGRTTT